MHNVSMSVGEYQNGGNTLEWEWLNYLQKRNHNRVQSKDRKTCIGALDVASERREEDMWLFSWRPSALHGPRRPTGPGQHVLQGNNWQVKGSTGRATAQLSQFWVRP